MKIKLKSNRKNLKESIILDNYNSKLESLKNEYYKIYDDYDKLGDDFIDYIKSNYTMKQIIDSLNKIRNNQYLKNVAKARLSTPAKNKYVLFVDSLFNDYHYVKSDKNSDTYKLAEFWMKPEDLNKLNEIYEKRVDLAKELKEKNILMQILKEDAKEELLKGLKIVSIDSQSNPTKTTEYSGTNKVISLDGKPTNTPEIKQRIEDYYNLRKLDELIDISFAGEDEDHNLIYSVNVYSD